MRHFKAHLRLFPLEEVPSSYYLPDGTESLLFRFTSGAVTSAFFGAFVDTDDHEPIYPGREVDARLRIWADEANQLESGDEFIIWYGSDVGRGAITAIADDAATST